MPPKLGPSKTTPADFKPYVSLSSSTVNASGSTAVPLDLEARTPFASNEKVLEQDDYDVAPDRCLRSQEKPASDPVDGKQILAEHVCSAAASEDAEDGGAAQEDVCRAAASGYAEDKAGAEPTSTETWDGFEQPMHLGAHAPPPALPLHSFAGHPHIPDESRALWPAQLQLDKVSFAVEGMVDGRVRIGWNTAASKLKPGFGQHVSNRIKFAFMKKMFEIMITLKEVQAPGESKENARRDRRNQSEANAACTIEVKLCGGLEGCRSGMLTYFECLGDGENRMLPRREMHDFKRAHISRGSTEWRYPEAVNPSSQLLLVCLEFLPQEQAPFQGSQ